MYDEFYNSLVSMPESILTLPVRADTSIQENYVPDAARK